MEGSIEPCGDAMFIHIMNASLAQRGLPTIPTQTSSERLRRSKSDNSMRSETQSAKPAAKQTTSIDDIMQRSNERLVRITQLHQRERAKTNSSAPKTTVPKKSK